MSSLESRIAAVGAMTPTALASEWRRRVGSEPPALPASLLARAITYALQEKAIGKLAQSHVRRLERVADRLDEVNQGDKAPRWCQPGSRLVREWHGRTYQVEVKGEGSYVYAGREYSSLSRIAREITGTRWSGPRFFGVEG